MRKHWIFVYVAIIVLLSGSIVEGVSAETFNRTHSQSQTTTNSPPESNTRVTHIMNSTLASWQHTMDHVPVPSIGCFNATFPSTSWVSEPCYPGGNDFAEIGNNYPDYFTIGGGTIISSAEGQFTSESGWSSEAQADFPYDTNIYSLQLNTNTFTTSYGGHSNVEGWEQFVFYTPYCCTTYNVVKIQYVLIGYGAQYGCPSGWTDVSGSCYLNGGTVHTNGYYYPQYLYQQSISGVVSSTGDSATFCSAGTCYTASDGDILGLSNDWTNFEFNVFGWENGDGAIFSDNGVTPFALTVQTSSSLPLNTVGCLSQSSGTAEYNNMKLSPACSTDGLGGVTFSESLGYHLTMNFGVGGGSPSSGWYYSTQIYANPTADCNPSLGEYIFTSWSGSGSGSYTGSNDPQTITLSGAVSETAQYTWYNVKHCPQSPP
jgi:hypothetical protein